MANKIGCRVKINLLDAVWWEISYRQSTFSQHCVLFSLKLFRFTHVNVFWRENTCCSSCKARACHFSKSFLIFPSKDERFVCLPESVFISLVGIKCQLNVIVLGLSRRSRVNLKLKYSTVSSEFSPHRFLKASFRFEMDLKLEKWVHFCLHFISPLREFAYPLTFVFEMQTAKDSNENFSTHNMVFCYCTKINHFPSISLGIAIHRFIKNVGLNNYDRLFNGGNVLECFCILSGGCEREATLWISVVAVNSLLWNQWDNQRQFL